MVRHAELAVGLGTALCLGWLAATLPGAAGAGWPWGPASGGTAGAPAALPPLPSWLLGASMALVAAAAAVALSSPEGRRRVARRLVMGLVLALLALLAARIAPPPERLRAPAGPPPAPPAGPAWGDGARAGASPAVAPARPPAGTAAAAAAALLAWWAARRVPRRAGGREPDGTPVAAPDAPRPAAPVRAPELPTVARCWARMVELLGPRAGRAVEPPFTPRELARALVERGFDHPAVARLTELFEEVRYGGKPDAPRREEALAALAAVEETYGRP